MAIGRAEESAAIANLDRVRAASERDDAEGIIDASAYATRYYGEIIGLTSDPTDIIALAWGLEAIAGAMHHAARLIGERRADG